MNLNGKTALVLGAVKGIGRGIALALAESGCALALTHFDWPEALPPLRRKLAASGAAHLLIAADLRKPEAAVDAVTQAVERFGRLDILINNIERGGWPVVHGPYVPAQWDLEQRTTLDAKHWAFQAALAHLKATGDGAVVNISSVAAIVGRSGPASYVFNDGYAAANRAIGSLTETWARLAAPEVRVNEIMLGLVETRHGPGTRGWALLDDLQRRALVEHVLLGRIGTVSDVVRAVMFILRDAPYMTGSVVRLDGGFVLGASPVAPMPPGVDPPTENFKS
jgi:3-oxoacyl-[acyl-carrier protein] reductase